MCSVCIMQNNTFKNIWFDYKSEVIFGVVMVAVVVLSSYLAQFIPDDIYDRVLTPAFNIGTFTAAFAGMWIIFRHVENVRIRRAWGYALLIWGLGDLSYFVCYAIAPMQVMNMGAEHITTYELLIRKTPLNKWYIDTILGCELACKETKNTFKGKKIPPFCMKNLHKSKKRCNFAVDFNYTPLCKT